MSDEGLILLVPARGEDLGPDPVAPRLPARGGTVEAEVRDRAHTTVEVHPGHELRMREVPGRAAKLPDALGGQAPLLLEVLQQHLLKIPALVGRLQQELAADVQGIEHFTKNVDLQLAVSAVADAHRLGALIAREPGKLDLGEAPLAG